MSLIATKPIRLVLPAGTYRIEWSYGGNGATYKTASFNATLSTLGTYTKSFNNGNGSTSQQPYQGLGTPTQVVYALSGNNVGLRWATNQTATNFVFGLASGNSINLVVSRYDLATGGATTLTSNGWVLDDKSQNYQKTITGPTSLTIPAMGAGRTTATMYVNGTTSSSFTVTIS